MVRAIPFCDPRPRYTVAFSATLVAPYMVELRDWEQMDGAPESLVLASA